MTIINIVKMSFKSDNNTNTNNNNSTGRWTLIVFALLIATVQVALAALSDSTSNQQLPMQVLTNDKAAQLSRYQIIANDLSEPSDSSTSSLESPSRRVAASNQQQQQQNPQQQRQQQPQPQLTGALINGNHATYVEPPADFKPIIYDYEASQIYHLQQQQQQQRGQPSSVDSNQVGEGSVAGQHPEPQQRKPLNAKSGLSHHLHAGSKDDPMLISSDGPIVGAASAPSSSSLSAAPAEDGAELKPSIGRWNDWHDMSIEPDLASSDTLQSASISYPAAAARPSPAVAHSTRYHGFYRGGLANRQRPETGPFFFFGAAENGPQAADLDRSAVGRDTQEQQRRQVFAVKRPPVQQQQQQAAVKGGQASRTGRQPQPVRLALNLIDSSSRLQAPASGNIQAPAERSQANERQNQAELSSRPHDVSASASSAAEFKQQQQQQQKVRSKSSPSKRRLRLKRLRKSKTNAEVRIQPLQQQQHDPLPKQVNGLISNDNQIGRSQYRAASKAAPAHQSRVPGVAEPAQATVEAAAAAAAAAAGAAASSSSSSAMLQSSPATKRVLKRRKIKSQLPVGLSSWLLGGIRDLEGRHWQLPSEVVGRLAVNDVELSHAGGQMPQPVSAPSGNSVVLLDKPSEQTPAPPAPAAASAAARVPINQLIPR